MKSIARRLAAWLALTLGLAATPATAATELVEAGETQLVVEAGKGVLLRLDAPAEDIFIANPEIANVQVRSPRLIYVFGVAAGETTLYALDGEERAIYGASVAVRQNLGPLNTFLRDMMPDASVEARMAGGLLLLSGAAQDTATAEAAERYAMRYLGLDEAENVINQIAISQPNQVNLRVKFAEVSRSTLKELGVNFQSLFETGKSTIGLFTGRDFLTETLNPFNGAEGTLLGSASGADSLLFSRAGGNVQLSAVLDALENQGLASILAEPNLTAVSGETATFLAGGEFPVPIPDLNGIAIEFREFGIRLAFTPIVRSDDKISLRVAPEVSELTNAGAIQVQGIGVPSLSTRRVETTVELGSGQSFALAGLLQSDIRQDVNKFPGLGDIPILGALFRSDSFRHEETELVVIATPYIVRPVDHRQLALPQDRLKLPHDSDRYLHGEMLTVQPPPAAAPGGDRTGPSLRGRAGFAIH